MASDLDALEKLAREAFDRGATDVAERLCAKVLRLDANRPAPALLRIRALTALGRTPEALAAADDAAIRHPGDATAWSERGQLLARVAHVKDAILSLQRAVELDPTDLGATARLAGLLQSTGQSRLAAEAFRRASELERDPYSSKLHRSQACEEDRRYSEAGELLAEAARIMPQDDRAWVRLARIRQRLGQFDEAEECLRQAITANPNRASSYLDLARCRKIRPDDQPFLDRLARLVADGRFDASGRALLEYALGKANDDLGRYDEAIRHLDEANRLMKSRLRRPFNLETRRREIEQRIATYTPEFLAGLRGQGNPSELPVLIVGMIRSGTTLVEQIVGSHPAVAMGGELTFWIVNLEGSDPGAAHGFGEEYLNLLGDLGPNAERVTDKMPHNFVHLGEIHAALPNARIVHCRRQPIDTALSIYLTPFYQPVPFAHDRRVIVDYYRLYERLMDHWRSVLPANRFIEIDYEAVVEDREATTRRLLEFIGLPWNDAALHPETNAGPVRTPSLWQVRQPVYASSIERWRRYEPWLGELSELIRTSSA